MEPNNPFSPPQARLEDAPSEMELASLGQRFSAAVIDAIIGFAYALPLMFLLGTWESFTQGVELPLTTQLLLGALGFGCFLLVHGHFLRTNGQTIGKKVMGIKIVDLEYRLPTIEVLILKRYLPVALATLVPFIGSLLTLIDVLFIFGAERRCIHDRIAGTRVVQVRPAVAG